MMLWRLSWTQVSTLTPNTQSSMNSCEVLQVSHADRVLPALHLHLCFSVSFSCRSLSPLLPSPHRLLPISPTDPITNCFLTGRELPCSAEEAGASLLLWCDQTLRYTPTDQGGELMCVYIFVCVYSMRVCHFNWTDRVWYSHPVFLCWKGGVPFSPLTHWMWTGLLWL